MPNHCSNWLHVEGPEKEIRRFTDTVTDELDFDKTVPCPEELLNMTASSLPDANKTIETIKGDDSFSFISNCPLCRHSNVSDEDIVACPQCGNDYVNPKEIIQDKIIERNTDTELLAKYGAKDWYDWKLTNWGTKWSAYDVTVECETDTFISYCFTTAWSPGIAWLEKTASQFPELKFSLTYEELGDCFKGEFTIQGDDVIEQWEDEISEDELRERFPDLYEDEDEEEIVSQKDE